MSATRGARHLSLSIRLADPLSLDTAVGLADNLALAINVPSVISQRVGGVVNYQVQLPDGYWEFYGRGDINDLGVGLGDSRSQVDYDFTIPHSLLAGTTGSGKSEGVRTILTTLFTSYTPDELTCLLIDPNGDYECFQSSAHLAAPVAVQPDEIGRALAFAGQQLAYRKAGNIRDAGRVLVVTDEAEDVARDAGNLAILQAIASQGRKYRVNLLAASQKPTQSHMPGLVDKLNCRFVGLVDNAHTSARLTGQAGLNCHQLTGEGDFIKIVGAHVQRFQFALTEAADMDALPRGQVVEPDVEDEDSNPTLNFPMSKPPGRPETEIEPVKVAHYLAHGPQNITIAWARDNLDLARYAHNSHRDFATELAEELAKLQRAMEESDE